MQVVGGPGAFAGSLTVLTGAIVVKCVAFAFLQKKLSFMSSALYMLAGNAVTTVIGVLAGALIGSFVWLIGVPLVWLFCLLPAKRLIRAAPNGWFKNESSGVLAAKMTGGLLLSCFLFSFARIAVDGEGLLSYWWFKITATYIALAIGAAIMLPKRLKSPNFLVPEQSELVR